jgi:hypothetical protein
MFLSLLMSFGGFLGAAALVLCVIGVGVRLLMWLCARPLAFLVLLGAVVLGIFGVK